jgi:hypothetical protein
VQGEDGIVRLVNVSDGGRGINRKRQTLQNNGKGIMRPRLHVGNGGKGQGVTAVTALQEYMQALSARLRRVRVCSGDWSRVMGPSVTTNHGVTAVFLDPPYNADAKRASGLYRMDDESIAHDVREWAIANGDNPLLRIALCGYEHEHGQYMPATWDSFAWDAGTGYAGQRKGEANGNGKAERIWFSPHCVKPETAVQRSWLEGR